MALLLPRRARPVALCGAPSRASITISGTIQVGSTVTITTSGTVTGLRRYLGGVDQGAISSPYTVVAADIGPSFTVRGNNGSVVSNALIFSDLATLSPKLLLDERGLTLVSTDHISAQADQSGLGVASFTQATDSQRPILDQTISGVDAPDFNGYTQTLQSTAALSAIATSQNVWIACVLFVKDPTSPASWLAATPATYYLGHAAFGSSANSMALEVYDVAGTKKVALGKYGGSTINAAEQTITRFVPHIIEARATGTTAGISVDGAAETTAAVDLSFNSTAETLGEGFTASGGVYPGLVGTLIAFNATPSANTKATIHAFLAYKYDTSERSAITGKTWLPCGDSETEGDTASAGDTVGGSRVVAAAYLRSLGKAFTVVGPYGSAAYGLHRGVAGETAQTVATTGLSAFNTLLSSTLPTFASMSWAVNDIAAGRTTAQVLADLDTIWTNGVASSPSTRWFVQTCIKPGAGAAAGYGSNRAECDTFNAALPAWAASRGITMIDRGAPPLGADQIHPTLWGYRSIGQAEGLALAAYV